jgi:ferredoxin
VGAKTFAMDDGNLAYIVDPDAEDDETVKLAAQSCPVLAIHLYDEDGKKVFPEE